VVDPGRGVEVDRGCWHFYGGEPVLKVMELLCGHGTNLMNVHPFGWLGLLLFGLLAECEWLIFLSIFCFDLLDEDDGLLNWFWMGLIDKIKILNMSHRLILPQSVC